MDTKAAAVIDELKAVRKQLGLTQEAMVHKLGCSVFTLQVWEQGRRQAGQRPCMATEPW